MNSSQLKILAINAMVLDHIAWILFPNIKIFHIIGKVAFPIFCYMIAEGYLKTRNKKKYLIRLIMIALISEIPFIITFRLAFGEQFIALNTIFDLVFGLIAIWIYDTSKSKYKILAVWFISILGLVLMVDGDFEGVWMIYFFYKYHDDFNTMAKKICMIVILGIAINISYMFINGIMCGAELSLIMNYILSANFLGSLIINLFTLLALIPIKFYSGKKGLNVKWLFYGFYPAHLLILYSIKVFAM